MIVRDESAILERCLAAAAPHIDAWVIADTGSADRTPDLVRQFFADRGIPGELHRFEFRDFGQARNQALTLARGSPLAFDYLLFVDADMELVVAAPDFRDRLTAHAYSLRQQNQIAYFNTRIVRRDVDARYVGVTHEYIDTGPPPVQLHDAWFIDHACGANRIGKFERDIRLLTGALADEPDNARYVFYLAQSLRDAGHLHDARAAYTRRAAMGGWEEEVWYAHYQVARLSEALQDPPDTVDAAFLAAYRARPARVEPLLELARRRRLRSDWPQALLYARAARAAPRPDDRLFLDLGAYDWKPLDEIAISAWYAGARSEGSAAAERLVADRRYPESEHPRILQNLEWYRKPVA